jgi:hypothetical protein
MRKMRTPLTPVVEQVADGVWRYAGDVKHTMNVYLVAEADGSGVFAFDAGTRAMAKGLRAAAGLGWWPGRDRRHRFPRKDRRAG